MLNAEPVANSCRQGLFNLDLGLSLPGCCVIIRLKRHVNCFYPHVTVTAATKCSRGSVNMKKTAHLFLFLYNKLKRFSIKKNTRNNSV